jgi:gamma-glutamyltranspeptidase/glutathione hydrolase
MQLLFPVASHRKIKSPVRHRVIGLVLTVLLAFACTAEAEELQPVSVLDKEGYARISADGKVAVATVNPLASELAMQVVAKGGNAVDAALAAAFALGVVDGHNSGIGGGAFVLVRLADGRIIAIDGREMAPAAAHRDMYMVNGQVDPELSRTGPLAAGVPGSVAAFHQVQQLGGKLGFKEVLLPAAELAEKGFPLSPAKAERIAATAQNLARFPASAAIFLDDEGKPLAAGSLLRQPDLAHTYRQLAAKGPDYFYRGDFARRTERWMKANGGLITRKDFANYRTRLREPVKSEVAGYTLYGFPPPSSGGTHVAQILNILEALDWAKRSPAERYHLLAEAMKYAFADRAQWLGDSDFVEVPDGLADKAYGQLLAKNISLTEVAKTVSYSDPRELLKVQEAAEKDLEKHTTHIAAADLYGNWVAITTTVNTSFGSKVVIPGTGVVLNNQMDDFSAQPGAANAFGLVGSEANAVAGRKRPLSSMSPTLVFKGDQPVMTLGAAGGPTIISQVAQNLLYTLADNRLPDEALNQARIHQQWNPNVLFVEASMDKKLQEELTGLGHELRIWPSMGASQIIQLRDGRLYPYAEPRVIKRNSVANQ